MTVESEHPYSGDMVGEIDSFPTNSHRSLPGPLLRVFILLGTVIAIAVPIGRLFPQIGAPVAAIVLGSIFSVLVPIPDEVHSIIRKISRFSLQLSIIALGFSLSITQVLSTGASSIPVLAGTLLVALAGSYLIGKRLKVARNLRNLIGVGTAICGASAIAAVDSAIVAQDDEVSYAMTTIFTFNVLAAVIFPIIGHIFHMSDKSFATWAGTSINDLSSVVAAATSFGHLSTSYAVVVKLTRTLAIVPITAVISKLYRKTKENNNSGESPRVNTSRFHIRGIIPMFVVWFLVAVGVNSSGILPKGAVSVAQGAGIYTITVALAAIGLSSKVSKIKEKGYAPMVLGALLWIMVAGTSLAIQGLLG